MKFNQILKSSIPHLIACGIFLIILFIYFSPVFQHKVLGQTDVFHSIGTLKESQNFQKSSGEEILWTNSSFGGMPIWRGYGKNIITHLHYLITESIPSPVLICFLSFIGFYILLHILNLNPYLSFIGAAAYTFSSFNMISLEAGHINKVYDMALMAPIIGGIILAYKGKYWIGSGVTALFTSLQLFYGHLQITYYLLLLIIAIVIMQFIIAIQRKEITSFFKASLILLIGGLIGVSPNISKLWTTAEYAKSTTRGGSELTAEASDKSEGLSKDYALSWSNDIPETMTLFIPYFYGGSSHENLGKNSHLYKAIAKRASKQEAKTYSEREPLYWGEQPFTAGPVYVGAIVCFLFVLGFFIINDPMKWWILGISIIAIMLSWGKNFIWFTDIFFYYFPLYNKFRSVTMILVIVQITFTLLAFVTLRDIITNKIEKAQVLKGLKWTTIIMCGIALFFALFGTSLFNFTSATNDSTMMSQVPDWFWDAIIADRESVFRSDAIRSLILVLITAGLIWGLVENKISSIIFYSGLALLVLFDLIQVDKRYLNNEDFIAKKNIEKEIFTKTEADEQISQDPDPDFRVLNLSKGIGSLTSDAITSYYHKSLGGYSAIKLQRYQNIIDSALYKGNQSVINMFNTKYFIRQDSSGYTFAIRNPGALGHAWFVDNYKLVKNANEEIKEIQSFNPANTAIIDEKFKDQITDKTFTKSPSDSIKLINYHPNHLKYISNTTSPELAVFSEIYYQPGWDAYIDDRPAPHIRADYILRAMIVPAGKHTIEFRFEPKSYFIGEKISLAGSIILILFVVFIFGREIMQYSKQHA